MKNFKQIFGVVILLAFFSFQNQLKAQANCASYLVTNNTGCVIVFDVQSYCAGSPSTCGSVFGQNLAAGATYTITGCSGCSSCDFDVILQSVNGNTLGLPVNVNSNFISNPWNSANCSGGCNGNLKWYTGITIVD